MGYNTLSVRTNQTFGELNTTTAFDRQHITATNNNNVHRNIPTTSNKHEQQNYAPQTT